MKFIDYYEVLGVDEKADAAEIKKAYRRLARKYHPDVSKERDAEDQFKRVNEAYEVLRDDTRRAEYDQLRRYGARPGEEFRPPPGWQSHAGGFRAEAGDGGFSDFFEAIFGAARARRAGAGVGGGGFEFGGGFGGFEGQPGGQSAGQDSQHRLEISLEEAFHGGSRRLSLSDPGSGRSRSLDVRIPSGVTEGQRIRLRGQGSAGMRGGPAGDLYLEMHIRPHRLFTLDGRNLRLSLPVAPWEAVLGAEVEVPTLSGTVSLKVPAGSSAGRRMRLKGRGLPGKPPGDLIVELVIVVPGELDERGRELMQELAESSRFDPRATLRA